MGGDSPKKGLFFKTIQQGWFRDLFIGHSRLDFDGFRWKARGYMKPTSAFARPTSYLDELPEGSSRARVGSVWQADGGEAPVHPICQVLALY